MLTVLEKSLFRKTSAGATIRAATVSMTILRLDIFRNILKSDLRVMKITELSLFNPFH